MSGDIGDGTTRSTMKYAQIALESRLQGFIQVAGGTNGHTLDKLNALGLLQGSERYSAKRQVAGIAYGSYARTLFEPLQSQLDHPTHGIAQKVENVPTLLTAAVTLASTLVSPLKSHSRDLTHRTQGIS